MEDKMDAVVICKSCNNYEYYGEMRWLNGRCLCRRCYRAEYEMYYGKLYEWEDLDGEKPTVEEIESHKRKELLKS